MELFKSARIRAGNRILAKRSQKVRRHRGFVSITETKSVGVLWDISNPDDLVPISDFILEMGERGIKVDVIGFFSGKVLPDRLTAIRYLECLKREDYSFLYRPKSPAASRFIDFQYDIIVEICFRDNYPLRYISTLSVARMKVGPAYSDVEQRKHIDLLIETGKNKNVRDYLRQVVIYLEMIKK